VSDKAEEWVIKQIQDYGLEQVGFAVLAVIGLGFISGCGVGWFLTQRKTRKEIEQLRLANLKASGELVKDLAALRRDFITERELVDLSFRNMGEALRSFNAGKLSAIELRTCRDEMCSIYQNRYLPAFITYAESIAAVCEQPDTRVRAKTELITGLKTMCRFLEMVNLDDLLKKCAAAPFQLRTESRDGVFERVKVLVPWWHIQLLWQLYQLRNKTEPYLRR